MSIAVTCEDCGKNYRVPETAAGKRGKCKHCGNVFTVPAAPVVQPSSRSVQPSVSRAAAGSMVRSSRPKPPATPAPVRAMPEEPADEGEYALAGEPPSLSGSFEDDIAAERFDPTPIPSVYGNGRVGGRSFATALPFTGDYFKNFFQQATFGRWIFVLTIAAGLLCAVAGFINHTWWPLAGIAFVLIGLLQLVIGIIVLALRGVRAAQLDSSQTTVFLVLFFLTGGALAMIYLGRAAATNGVRFSFRPIGRLTLNTITMWGVAALLAFMPDITGVRPSAVQPQFAGNSTNNWTPAYSPPQYHPPTPMFNPPMVPQRSPVPPQNAFPGTRELQSTPPNAANPPVVSTASDPAPAAAPVDPATVDPNSPAALLNNQEYINKSRFNMSVMKARAYSWRVRRKTRLPTSIDDLKISTNSFDPRISPFDPSLGPAGYVFIPGNMTENDRIIFYDVGMLNKTGSALTLDMNGKSETYTREQLFAQPGVPQP